MKKTKSFFIKNSMISEIKYNNLIKVTTNTYDKTITKLVTKPLADSLFVFCPNLPSFSISLPGFTSVSLSGLSSEVLL